MRVAKNITTGAVGVVLVRPEQFHIRGGPSDGLTSRLRVSTKDATYLGEIVQITAVTQWGQELTIHCASGDFRSIAQGEDFSVQVASPEDRIWFFEKP